MNHLFQGIVVDLVQDVAVFTLASLAYGAVRSAGAKLWRFGGAIPIGILFGLAAAAVTLLALRSGSVSIANDGYAAVALAAPFGGVAATLTAALLAGGAAMLLLGPAADGAAVSIALAGAAGILLSELLRRRRMEFGPLPLVALSTLLLAANAALLFLPFETWRGLSRGGALVTALGLPLGTLVLGGLLLRWSLADRKLAEGERRLRALVSNLPAALLRMVASPSGEIAFPFVSAEAAELFGVARSEAEADGAILLRCLNADDLPVFKRTLYEAGKIFTPWSLDFRARGANGKERWLQGRATPEHGERGAIVWDGVITDISRRKEREEELRRSEDLNRLLGENATEIIMRIGADGKRAYVSPSVRPILGYDPDELVGEGALSLVHPGDIDRMRAAAERLEPGASAILIYRARRKDGSYAWLRDTRRRAVRNGVPGTRESVSVIRVFDQRGLDVEPRRPDDARIGKLPLAKLIDAAQAGVIVADPHQPDCPIIFANAAASAITGYDSAELIGRNARLLQGPETDPAAIAAIREAVAEERGISTTLVNYRKDGQPYWSKLEISPMRSEGGIDAFVSIFVDVSAEKRIEAELRQAREQAEQANLAKSEFLANVSHELRTPLNGVIGFTNLLLNENMPAEQHRYAAFARDAGSALLAIINNVLDLSKIEAGKLVLSESDFSVVELAVSCNTVVWHAAREKGLDLNFVLKPDVETHVRGDPDRIRQVLLNLLSNAIKFTRAGSVVLQIAKVEDMPGGTVLRFTVTDTGMGIPEEKQAQLFRKFSQVDERLGQKLGGTGLGLAICKSLVEQMGGTIGLKSTPGIGSSFFFTLPLKSAAAATPVPPSLVERPPRKARVLLAEDTPLNQELTVTLLRRAGHEVEIAGDGAAALAAVEQQDFDIVLMDVQMPVLDGIAAARAVRALPGAKGKLPIIAITARALSGDVERCREAGMNDHLAKPIDAAALLAMIDRWTREEGARAPARAAATDAPTPVHDPKVLASLEEHLGRERVAQILAGAAEDIARRIEKMRRHAENRALLGREAHELVSVAGNLGFQELVVASRVLMALCAEGRAAEIDGALEELRAAGERTRSILDQLTAERRPR